MAPSHVDLSVLWVPIMPETSKLGEQMEQVGKDATESFGKGSTGLGDKIHESVTKSKDKIKDVFHRTGSDAGKTMSDAFKEETKAVEDTAEDVGKKSGEKIKGSFRQAAGQLGKEMVSAIGPDVKRELGSRVEDVVGGAFKWALGDGAVSKQIGEAIGGAANQGVTSWIGDLQTKLIGTKDAAQQTRKAFADFGSGDTVGGVSKLVDGMGKLGIGVKDLPQPLQDAVGKINDAKATTQQWSDIFKDMPGKVGLIGTALTELAGPLAVALQASKDIDALMRQDGLDPNAKGDAAKKQFEDAFHRIHRDANGNIVVDPKAPKPPGVDMGGVGGIGRGGDVLGSGQDAYDAFSSGLPLPSPAASPVGGASSGGDRSQHPADTGSSGGSAGSDRLPSSFVSGASSSYSSPSDLHAGGSRIANLYAVARSLEGTPYSQALRNDCSGMVSKLATAALGMQPSVQFSTVNEGDWLMSHGFRPGVGPEGSLRVGWYDHGGGNAGHTAATLPNGMNAESGGAHGDFRVGAGAAGANDPQFTQHAWLPMDGKSPLGSQNDPLFVSAADKGSGAAGGDGGDSSSLAQQLGSGFLGGVAQSVGLDGSVFKTFSGASNPMDFGITKIGTGLLNWASGMMPAISGHSPKQQQQGHTYNVDQSFNLTQHGVEGNGETPYKAAMNSSNRTSALAANMPGQ